MPMKKTAGNSIKVRKKKMGTKANILACGNIQRYAPNTPLMAPLAPTMGSFSPPKRRLTSV